MFIAAVHKERVSEYNQLFMSVTVSYRCVQTNCCWDMVSSAVIANVLNELITALSDSSFSASHTLAQRLLCHADRSLKSLDLLRLAVFLKLRLSSQHAGLPSAYSQRAAVCAQTTREKVDGVPASHCAHAHHWAVHRTEAAFYCWPTVVELFSAQFGDLFYFRCKETLSGFGC